MRHHIIAAAITLAWLAPLSAGAQDRPSREARSGFELGVVSLDAEALNGRLSALGLPLAPERYVTTSASVQLHVRRLAIGLGSQNASPREVTSGETTLRVAGRLTMAQLGLDALRGDGRRVTPFGGIGHHQLDLRFSTAAPSDFGSTATTPRSSELSNGTWMALAGLAVEQRVMAIGQTSVAVTAQGGYLFDLGRSRWHADDVALVNAPDAPLHGATFRIGLSIARGGADR